MSREKKSIIDKGRYDCKAVFSLWHFLDNDYETEYRFVWIEKDVLRQNNRDLYSMSAS